MDSPATHTLPLNSLQAAEDDTVPASDATAATANDGGHPQQCGCTSYCSELLPGQQPNMPFGISSYGRRLEANKAALAQACAAAGVAPVLHALLVAMAMIETNHMCPT